MSQKREVLTKFLEKRMPQYYPALFTTEHHQIHTDGWALQVVTEARLLCVKSDDNTYPFMSMVS